MSTLDIRTCSLEKLTEIQFDSSEDRIVKDQNGIRISGKRFDGIKVIRTGSIVEFNIMMTTYKDLDNFIKACEKAKELWDHND